MPPSLRPACQIPRLTGIARPGLATDHGVRNRLAHGQWMYLLNNDNTDVSPTYMASVKRENLLSLQFKKSLMGYVSNAIHDLVVRPPPPTSRTPPEPFILSHPLSKSGRGA
jgi:hypothetical protein